MKQLCVQAEEQRCHAGCWESSLLLPDDWHSCSSAVTPFPLIIALHGLVLCSWQTASMQSSPPACASREHGDGVVQVLVYMVGEQSGRGLALAVVAFWMKTKIFSICHQPFIFNTRLNAKQKKERVSSVGDLVKKGGPTTLI